MVVDLAKTKESQKEPKLYVLKVIVPAAARATVLIDAGEYASLSHYNEKVTQSSVDQSHFKSLAGVPLATQGVEFAEAAEEHQDEQT